MVIQIEAATKNSYTLVRGYRQYDFTPLDAETVAVTCYANRMIVRREVSTEEARQQWRRLVHQGYQEF